MGVMAEQMTEKDRQMTKLADLYTAALKQIQDLTAELQEAKGIISAAVARGIGAKPNKKTGSARHHAKGKDKGKPNNHKRTGLRRPDRIDEEETADPHTCGNCGSSDLPECTALFKSGERMITPPAHHAWRTDPIRSWPSRPCLVNGAI